MALICIASACGILDSGPESFVVRVDSIVAPTIVKPDAPFTVTFFGLVGPNGCYSLVDVATTRTPGSLLIQFNGEKVDRVCGQEPVPLDHTLDLLPPFVDPFVIRVTQPSGPALEKSVRVE